MSTQLRVVHRTGYRYPDGATASFNEIRMIPRSTHEQQVLHSRVEIAPVPWTYAYTDYWGTAVTAFEVFERHESLEVTATSVVDVRRPGEQCDGLGWAEVESAQVADRFCEFLGLTDRVRPPDDLAAWVREVKDASATPRDAAERIIDRIHDHVSYVTGVTSVHGAAAEAWQQGSGVCQDLAHLAIGALRVAGVPCRYLSGYLMPNQDADIGVPYVGESHAWVQYWDGRWVGVDPTNNLRPGELHVEVAIGRDYADVPPLHGIFTGGKTADMFVAVEITRLT
ncbi:MAG: transglutaminase family protein [Nigerium sp.]|nr:transglutaminase family protein [Nigerium sp.]